MRKLLFLLIFPFASLCGQSFDSLLVEWNNLERTYIAAVGIKDRENAIINAKKMVTMCEEHFAKEDSVYAYAIVRLIDSYTNAGYYNRAKQFAEGHLPWIEDLLVIDKKKMPNIYSSVFLFYGNACFHLASVYASPDSTSKDGINLSLLSMEERRQRALEYYSDAVSYYELLLRVRPNHPDAPRNLVYTYNQKAELLGRYMGNLEGSKEALTQALRYGKDPHTYRMLGVVNGMLGNHQEAIKMFKEVLKIEENIAVIYNLEVAYRQLAKVSSSKGLQKKYSKKADEYEKRWKAIDPNYTP